MEPSALVARALSVDTGGIMLEALATPAYLPWSRIGSIYLVGAGKGCEAMAQSARSILSHRIRAGCLAVPHAASPVTSGRCRFIPAGHPFADEGSRIAAMAIKDLLEAAGPNDLVISLLSGGASAMVSLPPAGVAPEDKQTTISLLLQSGASIAEINTVRRHLSGLKGGRAAEAAFPARVWNLILSDVPGDDLATIGSGLFAPDPTTYVDAIRVLARHRIGHAVPAAVRSHLEQGAAGRHPDTPTVGDVVFQRTVNAIIGSNETALEGIRTEAAHEGIRRVRLLPGFLTGEARECAVRFAREMKAFASTTPEGTPALLIAGGETTVTVSGKGIGGRNQELALACASEIDGESGLFVLAAGSDGVDGVSDAAGAYADHTTRARGMALDLRLWSYLERNDSHSYFSALGDLIHTGPTGTNVADVALGLVLR